VRKRLTTLLLLALLAGGASAEENFTLQLRIDPPVVSERRLYELAGIPSDAIISTEAAPVIVRKVLAGLAAEGYPLAELKADETDSAKDLSLVVSAGPALTASKDADARFGSGKRLSPQLFAQVAEAILDSLTEAGFPFAKVEFNPSQLNVGEKEITVTPAIQIKLGVFERWGEARFPGSPQGDWSQLRLRSRIRRGEPFKKSALDKAIARLEREESIAEIGEPRLLPGSSGVLDLELPVETRSATKISGIMAVSQGSSKPAGDVRIEVGRLFKLGRSFSFAWKGLNPKRRGVEASFREGWIAGLPVSASAELKGESEDRIGSMSLYRLKGEFEPLAGVTLGLGAASQRTTASDSSRPSSRTSWIETGVTLDYLDDDWNPSNGYRFAVQDRIGNRNIDSVTGSREVHQNGARVEGAHPIRGKWVAFGRVELLQSTGALESEDLARVGGSASLRGYIEEEFLARGAMWGAIELRWRPDRKSGYLGLFVDGADLYRLEPTRPVNKRVFWSAGVTSAVETAAGRLGLDLGFVPGESFDQGRVHFRLTGWL